MALWRGIQLWSPSWLEELAVIIGPSTQRAQRMASLDKGKWTSNYRSWHRAETQCPSTHVPFQDNSLQHQPPLSRQTWILCIWKDHYWGMLHTRNLWHGSEISAHISTHQSLAGWEDGSQAGKKQVRLNITWSDVCFTWNKSPLPANVSKLIMTSCCVKKMKDALNFHKIWFNCPNKKTS